MHEHECNPTVAAICFSARESAEDRQAQRPDARRPLVASSAQHGAGLADSAESSTSQGQCHQVDQVDMGGIRALGGRHGRHEGESRPEERLAPVGLPASERGKPLHSQAGPTEVEVLPPRGGVSVENVLRLLEHQQYRCALTGRRLTPQTAALDHIIPVRQCGKHVIENTQVLHKDVNRAKGTMTNAEFLAMCREVVAWADSGKGRTTISGKTGHG